MDQVTVPRELLRQVLDALCAEIDFGEGDGDPKVFRAATALRSALEQPAVEPVAWRWAYKGEPDSDKCFPMPVPDQDVQDVAKMRAFPRTVQLLYAAPQAQQPAPVCNPHPKAPHGFDRNASHSAHRYVCDCESWEPYDAGYNDGFQAGLKAEQALCELSDQTQEMEAQQPRKAVKLTTDEYTALAHRIASKYTHRSDPAFTGYTFLPHTLEQFVRAVEQAVWEKLGVIT